MRSEQEANRAIELYSDTVKRICMVYLKNQFDTEDINLKMKNMKKHGLSQ